MRGLLTKELSGAQTTTSDAAIMRTIAATVLAILVAILLQGLLPQTPDKATEMHDEIQATVRDGKQESIDTTHATPMAEAKPVEIPKPVEQPPAPAVPQPQAWAVTESPHKRVPVETINVALAHLQKKGLSKEGAAYLVGNFVGESYLIPCGQYGDGGKAHGLAQWHPGRRQDMPCGFIEQLDWAIDVEMVRDSKGNYPCPCEALKTADIGTIKLRLKQWERYGVEGDRWAYAAAIYKQL